MLKTDKKMSLNLTIIRWVEETIEKLINNMSAKMLGNTVLKACVR